MSNETKQPFDQIKRNPDDAALVEGVLGSKAADEMKELAGTGKKGAKPRETELSLSAEEARATKEKEEEVVPEQRRQQYYEWAEGVNRDKEWVDDMFIFQSDGKVKLEKSMDLNGTGFNEFPPGLYCSGASISIANNGLEELKGVPDGVMELDLSSNHITSIGDLPKTIIALYLEGNPINDLSSLVGKTVGLLNLCSIPAESIPRGIGAEFLVLYRHQTKLAQDARKKGYDIRYYDDDI